MNITSRASIVLGSTIVALAIAAPAVAEGGFSSSLSGWGVGAESRTWQDNNLDSVNGYAQFHGCKEVPTYDFKIGVYKEDAGPDTQMAIKWVDCVNNVLPPSGVWPRIYFGDVAKDQYHFTLKDVHTLGQRIDVTSVVVKY